MQFLSHQETQDECRLAAHPKENRIGKRALESCYNNNVVSKERQEATYPIGNGIRVADAGARSIGEIYCSTRFERSRKRR
jgi:hypothetical protein